MTAPLPPFDLLRPRRTILGMSAVLRPEKNPLQLVDALALLRSRGIPARVLFIGDGEMRPALEARARAAGVAGEVLIAGLQSDVRPLVSACDAMTLCSTSIETRRSTSAIDSGRPTRVSTTPTSDGSCVSRPSSTRRTNATGRPR